jgi:predicted  nucleic acid-binding Zn-ribbon protein
MQELLSVRKTEQEEALDQYKAQFEAQSQSPLIYFLLMQSFNDIFSAQERLIQELTTQLARVEPLARTGNSSALRFLTREAADEEQRTLENQLTELKHTLEDKNTQIVHLRRRGIRKVSHDLPNQTNIMSIQIHRRRVRT